jgi:hypothetical protein
LTTTTALIASRPLPNRNSTPAALKLSNPLSLSPKLILPLWNLRSRKNRKLLFLSYGSLEETEGRCRQIATRPSITSFYFWSMRVMMRASLK